MNVRKFTMQRLAEQSGNKKFGINAMSLADIENMFVAKLTEKCNLTERDISRVFKRFDKDNSGFLSADELASAIHLYLNGVEYSRVIELVQHYDVDGDGSISLEEFTSFLISRTHEDKGSWQTVETLIERSPTRLKKRQESSIDESNFEVAQEDEKGRENDASAVNVPQALQSTSHRASVFLQNTKALLLKRAQEARQEGLIPAEERLSKHLAPLAESVARSILSKAFQPYMKAGCMRVDEAAFARILSKFTYPGSPPPRKDVIKFVFDICRENQALADPDLLVDMIFDKGGFRLNQWGFAQEVVAATDTGRPAVGRGPFIRREGDLPAKVSDVPYRLNTPQSRTALAAPSDFNPQLIERSFTRPRYSIDRDFVYGINLNMYSGEPVVYLQESKHEVLYAAAALMVIHDMANNTQAYFEGHSDDITCFSVSNDGTLVASGQMGKNPFVMIWETALEREVYTPGPHANLENTPVGLVARIGRGWFARGVCATCFSADNKFLCAISCDDKHDMGVWSVFNGELLANIPTAPGIPPQVRCLKWSPSSFQDTGFINKDHAESDCDLIVTGGEHNFLRFWSFKRPNKLGVGASISGRGHRTPKSVGVGPPDTHKCAIFLPRQNDEDPVAAQYDVLTAGDNGYVYLWQEGGCVRCSQALGDGNSINSMCLEDDLLVVGGSGGVVACLDPVSLEVLNTTSVVGSTPKPGCGPPTTSQRIKHCAPTNGNIGSVGGVGGADISLRAQNTVFRRPSSGTRNLAKRPQPKNPVRDKNKWKGPALLDDEKPLPPFVKSTADVLGMTIVCSGSDSDGNVEKYIVCATGFGKLMRLPLPSRNNRREMATSAEPITVHYYHCAPLYALSAAPSNMIMAPGKTLFATGGDDAWLCLWNSDSKRLIVRTKARASVRCIAIDKTGCVFAVGLAGGAFTLYFCDVSNSAAKSLKSQGKSAAAFQRATEFVFDTSLTECAHRRDCKEDISDIKFSPNGRMLAVASHDGVIDIYGVRYTPGNLQTRHSDLVLKYLKRLRGHSSFVLHIDWSEDNRLMQSTCGANEILYWDIEHGRQLLSSNDCVEGDTDWETESCHLGFGVMGIWGEGNQKGSDINTVDVSRGLSTSSFHGPLVATGDDKGRLQIFNYPCVVKNAPHVTRVGHSSHIMTTKWLEKSGRGVLGSVGGNDNTAIVWKVTPQ
eukprot:GSChrysophyteH1.ASY1.ANO1.2327.1 assembled CDS